MCGGPQMSWTLKYVQGSFGLESILLKEQSIPAPCYKIYIYIYIYIYIHIHTHTHTHTQSSRGSSGYLPLSPHLLWNLNVHCRVPKGHAIVHYLCQINPVDTLTSCLRFISILSSHLLRSLPSDQVVLQIFPPKSRFNFFPMRATCPTPHFVTMWRGNMMKFPFF